MHGIDDRARLPTIHILSGVGEMRLVVVIVLLGFCAPGLAESLSEKYDDYERELADYGQALARSTDGAIAYDGANQTKSAPLSYRLNFTTTNPDLMSNPAGDRDATAHAENTATTAVWDQKFCTKELKSLMRDNIIFLVAGALTNPAGEVQSMSVCYR